MITSSHVFHLDGCALDSSTNIFVTIYWKFLRRKGRNQHIQKTRILLPIPLPLQNHPQKVKLNKRESEGGDIRGGQKSDILKRDGRKWAVQRSQGGSAQWALKGKCESSVRPSTPPATGGTVTTPQAQRPYLPYLQREPLDFNLMPLTIKEWSRRLIAKIGGVFRWRYFWTFFF